MPAQNPRQIAAQVLLLRETAEDYVETLLETELARSNLSAPDRKLCQELTYGSARWQRTLDWLIAQKTKGREQKPLLQIILRLGLYQIFWLDRIPNHAAVNETVELAKRNGFTGQAGFVNAILRGYLREFDATKKLLAELKTSQPALGHSHPDWLYERWKNRWGAEKVAKLMEWNNTPPKTFARVNTLKPISRRAELHDAPTSEETSGRRGTPPSENSVGELLEQWRSEGVEAKPVARDWLPANLVFELMSHPPLATLKSFQQGFFYVQDPGTLLAVRELDPQPGEMILDLCAAPGGKTTFIAQLMRNEGRVVAQDISGERLNLVRENCERLGITCVEAASDSSFILHPSSFDKVMIDAPCSNTGVMRRRVDLRWRIAPEEISRLQTTQLNLLDRAALQLKPGGVLVYSTCSLEPEENSEVVKRFLSDHAGFKLESERELLPFVDGVDGAFVARLRYD